MNEPQSLFLSNDRLAIATDLYQLTMMAGYLALNPEQKGTFELFARRLPANRSCLIAAGLEQAVHYLTNLHFTDDDIDFLKKHPAFKKTETSFFDYLRNFRFRGDLFAVPEGTPVFPDQPILRVTGSMPEAQLVESYLLSIINAQTLIASKAARIVQACNGKPVYEFGLRRAHGPQAAIYACRAAYIAGFTGTSDVLAAKLLEVPMVGTMAHSWVMSNSDEEAALKSFRALYDQATLLIDTYDTVNGAKLACQTGPNLQGVRIDSGDLLETAIKIRKILDDNGQSQAKLHASGDLNEEIISRLEHLKVPFDVFAVGTELMVSKDSPSLNVVYKLVSVTDNNGAWRPVAKASKGKRTIGGAKQIWRQVSADSKYLGDVLALDSEDISAGRKLLKQIMSNGKLIVDLPSLNEIRQYCAQCQIELGPEYFGPGRSQDEIVYPVKLSQCLSDTQPYSSHVK